MKWLVLFLVFGCVEAGVTHNTKKELIRKYSFYTPNYGTLYCEEYIPYSRLLNCVNGDNSKKFEIVYNPTNVVEIKE